MDKFGHRDVCTHYAVRSAARLDIFYVSANLNVKKVGVETIAAASVDDFALCVHVEMDVP
jgi:hypothetical protein